MGNDGSFPLEGVKEGEALGGGGGSGEEGAVDGGRGGGGSGLEGGGGGGRGGPWPGILGGGGGGGGVLPCVFAVTAGTKA